MGCDKRLPNPGIAGWVDLHPFRAWCLKTLPTLFDEEMSYYEALCVLQRHLSDMVEDVNLLGEEFVKLKNYVEDYFDNLDYQKEIDKILDELATNGTLQNWVNLYMENYNFKPIVNTIIDEMAESGELGEIIDTQLPKYFNSGIYVNKNAIFVGTNSGEVFAPALFNALKFNMKIILTHQNTGVIEGGVKNYISRLVQWAKDNPALVDKIAYIFIEQSPFDMEYTTDHVREKGKELFEYANNFFKNARLVNIPLIVPYDSKLGGKNWGVYYYATKAVTPAYALLCDLGYMGLTFDTLFNADGTVKEGTGGTFATLFSYAIFGHGIGGWKLGSGLTVTLPYGTAACSCYGDYTVLYYRFKLKASKTVTSQIILFPFIQGVYYRWGYIIQIAKYKEDEPYTAQTFTAQMINSAIDISIEEGFVYDTIVPLYIY